MTAPLKFTPYSTARPLMGALPTYVNPLDAERLLSYLIYEKMYWNAPETYKLVSRGTEDNPIYIPSAKIIIEACNRYFAVGFDYVLDTGTDSDRTLARGMMDRLFRREQFFAKFNSAKRYGLMRGDALWHIVADPTKSDGNRISMHELDPSSYFPIYEADNLDRLIGCHIMDQVKEGEDVVARRQTYLKVVTPAGTKIESSLALYEIDKWDDRDGFQELSLIRVINQPTPLPDQITALPVYHIKNQREGANPFGSSEIRGLERIAAAINQSVSDEELTLALEGLGLYSTTSGPPVNDDGEPVDWILGPGRVVEIDPDSTFNRVNGVGTITPSQDHIKYLTTAMREATATPDIAIGSVDVATAESGIALQLRMAPILAKNLEKESELLSVYDHLFYDLLNGWFPAFEGIALAVGATPIVGNPLPIDRKAILDEIVALMSTNPPLVTADWARQVLQARLGYEFPGTMGTEVIEEAGDISIVRDPFAARLRRELADDTAQL